MGANTRHSVRRRSGQGNVAKLRAWLTGSVAVGAFALFGVAVTVDQARAQAMSEELDYLIRTNPQIEAQRAILRRAQESVRAARAGYLPIVAATGSLGNELTDSPTTRTSGNDDSWVPFRALGIEIRQNLFDGLFTTNTVDSSLMARDSVAFALNNTVQTVMLQGATVYLEVLRLNELIRVARARERTIREQLELETERVERGAGIEVDVLQNKSRLQLAIEARVDLEGQLRQAVAQYIQLFERDPDITRMRLMPPPLELVPPTLEEALFLARDENPLLASRAFLTRAARFTVDAQRSGYVPRFDAVGRLDVENNVGGSIGHERTAAVLIEMSWDLFSGFLTTANVASAQESLIEQLALNDSTERDVERLVRQAWSKLENTRTRKDLLLNAVSIAQEVFQARQRLRESGKETALNVLDAENEVFQAEQNLIRADYDSRIATYELAAAMGVLSPAMLGLQTPIIDNAEMFFVDEGEVRDPEPVRDVEAYWSGVQSQRNEPVGASRLDRPSASPAAQAGAVAPSVLPQTPSVQQQDLAPSPAPESDADDFTLPLDLESKGSDEGDGASATASAVAVPSVETQIEPVAGASSEQPLKPASEKDAHFATMVASILTKEPVDEPAESAAVAAETLSGDVDIANPVVAEVATVVEEAAAGALPNGFAGEVAAGLTADRTGARAPTAVSTLATPSAPVAGAATEVPVVRVQSAAVPTLPPVITPPQPASQDAAISTWPLESLVTEGGAGAALFDVPGSTLFGSRDSVGVPAAVPR